MTEKVAVNEIDGHMDSESGEGLHGGHFNDPVN